MLASGVKPTDGTHSNSSIPAYFDIEGEAAEVEEQHVECEALKAEPAAAETEQDAATESKTN